MTAPATSSDQPAKITPRHLRPHRRNHIDVEQLPHSQQAAVELDIPEALIHRVIQRESDYRADARNGP